MMNPSIEMAASIPGWMDWPELQWLYDRALEAVDVIEIGCFMGRSTCAIASGLAASGHPGRTVTVIDTFDGAGTVCQDEIAGHDRNWLYQRFLESMDQAHLRNFRVILASSQDADVASGFGDHAASMVFIDGQHTYEHVKRDLELWVPKAHGIVCGHDFHPDWPGVVRAVDEYFQQRLPRRVTNPAGSIWSVQL